ncbi:hypothetical protein POTOM_026216 [Populus tomentosa]|uniref:Uncharacterized protein n=1 Tax=Populus tomentosa TaxID=118781 RepID=A0A8X7ZK65_POPTO|nr:hypothetical protein POTOM_026216 [Populus tomentosa]
MMRVYLRSQCVEERMTINKAIEQHHTNRINVRKLKEKKATKYAKLKSVKKLGEVYNRIDSLEKEIYKLMEYKEVPDFEDSMHGQLRPRIKCMLPKSQT